MPRISDAAMSGAWIATLTRRGGGAYVTRDQGALIPELGGLPHRRPCSGVS
jgi:hypothetical protein